MNPKDIQRLNEKLNFNTNPLGSNPLFLNDWTKIIPKIAIKQIPPQFIDISDIAGNLYDIFNSQTLKRLDEISQSTLKISEIFKNVDDLTAKFRIYNYDFSEIIENFEDEKVIEKDTPKIKDFILNETKNLKRMIFDIYLNNQKLYEISPRDFEKMIAELLFDKGFEVELTKQTRDNGYDILALKHVKDFSPVKYLVECKRYSPERKVGVEIIRSFKDVLVTEKANKGIIVTTSYFTSEAIKKQTENPLLLDYKNKDELMEWVNEYYNQKANR
jgi:HJR/Mrr/RecB family endonuclease